MPNAQDPSHPLRSVLETVKNHLRPETEALRRRGGGPGVLSGDDYPELPGPARRLRPEPQADPPPEEGAEARLEGLLEEGRLRALDADRIRSVFMEMLREGLLEAFVQAIDQVRAALNSPDPEDRRWGLESVRVLLTLEDATLIPYGTLPLLLDCVAHTLVREDDVDLQATALGLVASLLGVEAFEEGPDRVQARLAWLERTAGVQGTGFASHILASRELAMPSLEHFFRRGHTVLESRVLPFFQSLGEQGARTLVTLLDEEGSRQHRNRILELLKLLGPSSFPALKEGLQGGSWQLVRNALNLVGELEEGQAFDDVVPCLAHPDARVVHAAVRALWKTGGMRAEPHLLALLADGDGAFLEEILLGLGQVGTAAAVPALERLAGDGHEDLRLQALDTLARLKRPEAVPFLEGQLRRQGRIFKTSQPMGIRLAAARALAAIGTKEACRALGDALSAEPRGPSRDALHQVMEGLDAWG